MLNSFAYLIGPTLITLYPLLITLVSYIYYTIVLKFSSQNWLNSTMWIHVIWTLYLLHCILFYYIHCVFTDPNGDFIFLISDNSDENCKSCKREKPERAHHCRVCQACILQMDHHCIWIHNCVGKHNHRYFWLFIMYMWIGCCYYFCMTFSLLKSVVFHVPMDTLVEWPFRNAKNVFIFTSLISLVAAWGLFPLLLWQSYLILSGQTTIEYFSNKRIRQAALLDGIPFINVYDLGWRQNVIHFFQE